MSRPVPATGVMRCLDARPAQFGTKAREVAAMVRRPYSPSSDYWKWMRDHGVSKDRTGSRDGQALINAASTVQDVRKRPHYAAVAENWPVIAERWDACEHVVVPNRTAEIAGRVVKPTIHFTEGHPSGRMEHVYVWYAIPEIGPDAVDAYLRMVELAYPGDVSTFIDARRPEHSRTSEGRRLDSLDEWIASGALYLGSLLDEHEGEGAA